MAESADGISGWRFWDYPITLPEWGEPATNVYDMRLTRHEDGWIYGIFCVERKDHTAEDDLSAATAAAGVVRTRDLKTWERLPDIRSASQQRNVVLHPEFVEGKYALYTRPADGFIDTGSGGGIGWALVDDMENAVIGDEKIINTRRYHTIKGDQERRGPAPDQDAAGLAASGARRKDLRMGTALRALHVHDGTGRPIARHGRAWRILPRAAGRRVRIGDVGNVVFSNGWIVEPDGRVLIYYASSDTRMHVAESSVERLVDYCLQHPADGLTTGASVRTIVEMIDKNRGK